MTTPRCHDFQDEERDALLEHACDMGFSKRDVATILEAKPSGMSFTEFVVHGAVCYARGMIHGRND
jgi:hypothetical protein